MKYFKYAVRVQRVVTDRDGRRWHQSLVGVSNESEMAAQQEGETRLNRLPQTLPNRPRSVSQPMDDHYAQYGNRPVIEEVIKELFDDRHQLAGILTRNHYGSVVMNAAKVPFFDIDSFGGREASAHPTRRGMWSWLLGKFGSYSSDSAQTPAELSTLITTLKQFPDLIFRVYRTAAGYRIMLLNRLMEPGASLTQRLFRDLGCDPLYQRLCGSQECFRARLTPKPWRCGLAAPNSRFPRKESGSQQRFQAWLTRYEATISHFGVCQWVVDVGRDYQITDLPSETQLLLSIHDAFTLKPEPARLA